MNRCPGLCRTPHSMTTRHSQQNPSRDLLSFEDLPASQWSTAPIFCLPPSIDRVGFLGWKKRRLPPVAQYRAPDGEVRRQAASAYPKRTSIKEVPKARLTRFGVPSSWRRSGQVGGDNAGKDDPVEGSRPADAGNSDGTPFDLPQVQLSSLIGIHSVLLRLRRRSMGRFTHWGRAKRVLPPA